MSKYYRLVGAVSLLLFGFVLGIVFMGVLSQKASRSYLEVIRSNYALEQERLAVRAKQKGDLEEALFHYRNLVDASSSDNVFDSRSSAWSFSFPFAAILLDRMAEEADPQGIGRARSEGINRGRLAAILEDLGKQEEAREEYEKASSLIGFKDTKRVKELIRGLEEMIQGEWKDLKQLKELRYPNSYDFRTHERPEYDTFTITYKTRLSYPSTAVLNFYDQELKKIGWNPFTDPGDEHTFQEWDCFIDGTREGDPIVNRLMAKWANRQETRMVLLVIRYYSYNVEHCPHEPNSDVQHVIFQIMPFVEYPPKKNAKQDQPSIFTMSSQDYERMADESCIPSYHVVVTDRSNYRTR